MIGDFPMQFDFQTVCAIAIVGWAALVLARRLNPFSSRRQGHCGSCNGCTKQPATLHQLGQLRVKT
jgi:hypothetical protein